MKVNQGASLAIEYLAEFATRSVAEAEESRLIRTYASHPLCRNIMQRVPKTGHGTNRSRTYQGTIKSKRGMRETCPQNFADPPFRDLMAERRRQLASRLREAGVIITPMHQELCQWVNAGITDEEIAEAVARARFRKPAPELPPAGYVGKIVSTMLGKRERRTGTIPIGDEQQRCLVRRYDRSGHASCTLVGSMTPWRRRSIYSTSVC
jgi:hypothetical protein